jgi:chromate transporter
MPTDREPAAPSRTAPTLAALFMSFAGVGLASFGGGLTSWIRREVVLRRGWLDDQQFLSGYALSQIVPGASNVNLAVFIGTQLRGWTGALACFLGMCAPPVVIILVIGGLYFGARGSTAADYVGTALTGMGAVAIGLNLGTGLQLAWLGIRRIIPALIAAVVAIAIGVLRFPLIPVLAIMIPVSLLLAILTRPAADRAR